MKREEIKHILKEVILDVIKESDEMTLFSPRRASTFQQFLSGFEGMTLQDLQDKSSYVNLYLGNKYGMTWQFARGEYPEAQLQKLVNTIVSYFFKRIMWVQTQKIKDEIESSKKGNMKAAYDAYQSLWKQWGDRNREVLKNKDMDLYRKNSTQKRSELDATEWGRYERERNNYIDQLRRELSYHKITQQDVKPDLKDKVSLEPYVTASKLFNKLKTKTI